MKKIIIGIAIVLGFSMPLCFAASNIPSNEVSPYYNSGFSFGLASCARPAMPSAPELDLSQGGIGLNEGSQAQLEMQS
jgi:hypothetical protein